MAVRIRREPGPSAALDEADFVTLRLRTDDGIEGIAYAGFASRLVTRALKELLDALASETVGADPHAVEEIGRGLLLEAGDGSPAGLVTRAVSAIDVALWDIRGKALGMPVWKLLGAVSGVMPTYASGYLWRHFDLDELATTASALVSKGFRAMKFRMGGEETIEAEMARLRTMREAVGDRIELMVDINQGWDVNRAIAAGEYAYGIEPFRHMLEARSIDIVMVDLLRGGGITQWMKVAHMAEGYNLPVVTHLAPEILGHALAAAPNGLYVEHMPWAFPLFEEVPTLDASGQLAMPDAPGLGLAFDEARLASAAL